MRRWWLIGLSLFVLAIGGAFFYINSIDWNEHKSRIASEISELTGKKVEFSGAFSLSIFPSPNLVINDVKIYSADPKVQKPLLEVKKLVAKLDLVPFLKGEFKFTRMSLSEPVLRLEFFNDGTFNWSSNLSENQRRALEDVQVTLDSVTVENAQVDYADFKRDIHWVFTNLNAEIVAPTLFGPYRIDGSYVKNNQPEGFSLELGRFSEDFGMTVNVVFNNSTLNTIFRFDGSWLPNNESLTGNFIFESQNLADYINSNLKNFQLDKKYDSPLALSTAVNFSKQKYELSDLVVKYGATTAAGNIIVPKLDGANEIDWSKKEQTERPKIEMAFNLTELDLNFVQNLILDMKQRYFAEDKYGLSLPWDVIGDIRAVKALYRDDYLKDFVLSFDVLPGQINFNSLNTILPGDTVLNSKGVLSAGKENDVTYNFQVSAASENLSATLGWLDMLPEAPVNSVYKKLQLQSEFSGNFRQFKFSPFSMTLDTTQVNGSWGGNFARDDKPLNLFVALNTDSLNLGNYVSPLPKEIAESRFVNRLKYVLQKISPLGKYNVRFQNEVGLLVWNGIPAEGIVMGGNLTTDTLEFVNLNIDKLFNAKFAMKAKFSEIGSAEPKVESLEYEIQTKDAPSLFDTLEFYVPGFDADVMKNFASKGKLYGKFDAFSLETQNVLEDMNLSFNGLVSWSEKEKVFSGKLNLKNPDFVNMLNDFGVAYKPNAYSLGAFALDGTFFGNLDKFSLSDFTSSIGQNVFSGKLDYSQNQKRPNISADLKINQLELDRYLLGKKQEKDTTSIVFLKNNMNKPDFLGKPELSNEKIDYKFFNQFDLQAKLDIDKLIYKTWKLDGVRSSIDFNLGNLVFKDIAASWVGADVRGQLELEASTTPKMSMDMYFQSLPLSELGWLGKKYGIESGVANLHCVLDSLVESEMSLFNSLNGTVDFDFINMDLRGLALSVIEADLQQRKVSDGLSLMVKQNLESGSSHFEKAVGKLEFVNGAFELKNAQLSSSMWNMQVNARGSIPSWEGLFSMDVKFQNLRELPRIGFAFSGDLASPLLEVNVSSLANMYDAEKNKQEAYLRAQEQAKEDALKEKMSKQTDILKIVEGNLYKMERSFAESQKVLQSDEASEVKKRLKGELEALQKEKAEIATLSMTPKYDDTVIDDVKSRLDVLIMKVGDFKKNLDREVLSELKLQINQMFDEITALSDDSQKAIQSFREQKDVLEKRLAKIKTDYSLEKDTFLKDTNEKIEKLLADVVLVREKVSKLNLDVKVSTDQKNLLSYKEQCTEMLNTIKTDSEELKAIAGSYVEYAEIKVKGAEDVYNQALREEEVKRKLKENTGMISTKGGTKNLTVVRDIEDIEKAEKLQEGQALKVLDFSKEKKQNVVVRQDKTSTEKVQKSEGGFLRKSSGPISKVSGTITKK